MTRIRSLALGTAAVALMAGMPAAAQPAKPRAAPVSTAHDVGVTNAAAPQNGGEDVPSMFPDELKAGTLSAADNDKLNDLVVENIERLEVKWKRELGRSFAGLPGNLGKLDQAIADYKLDRQNHSHKMSATGITNLVVDALPELIDQIALPAHSEITVMGGDVIDLLNTIITARSNMAGADARKIAKLREKMDGFERWMGKFLYQSRDIMERISSAVREMTPEQRKKIANQIQAAVDRGDIVYDDDGNFKSGKPLPTPKDAPANQPAPAPDGPAAGPGTSPATDIPPSTDPNATSSDTTTSSAPDSSSAAPAPKRPVKRGVIPNPDAVDPSVMVSQETKDAYARYEAAQRAAANQAARQSAQTPQTDNPPSAPPPPPPPPPRVIRPVTLEYHRTPGDTPGNQPPSSNEDGGTINMGLDIDAYRAQKARDELRRNDGSQSSDTIDFLSLTSLFSDDPELMSALTVAWPEGADGKSRIVLPKITLPDNSNDGVYGGLDSAGTFDQQSGYDVFSTGPYTDPGGYGGALARGPYPNGDSAASQGWTSFDATSSVSTATLEPIYAGYDVNQQRGAAMQSLDLHAPAPTDVMTVPSTQVNVPSTQVTVPSTQVQTPGSAMTSPDLQPALCGR